MHTPLTQPIRVVQVGMGGWGSDWYKHVLSQNTDVDLVGFVDIEAAALAQAQAALALPAQSCFPSLEAALTNIPCDAVVITAALPGHVPSALAALSAGKHVLMEKPFAPSVAEARRVVEAADRCDRLLMISQTIAITRRFALSRHSYGQERWGRLARSVSPFECTPTPLRVTTTATTRYGTRC